VLGITALPGARQDIRRIRSALVPGALFFVLNSTKRCVPTDRGWGTDGNAIEELLAEEFEQISRTRRVPSRSFRDHRQGSLRHATPGPTLDRRRSILGSAM